MPCCAARPTRASSFPTRMLVGSEFNGAAPFLKGLNGGPDDLIPGVEMMAIRSDKNDKYSQPDGRFIGQPGKPTGVGYDASELRGAQQRRSSTASIIARRRSTSSPSPRSTSSSPARPPARCSSPRSRKPTLNGRVTGMADGLYTNLAGRRRRRRNLRGRSQDRRAQDAAAGASQDDRRRRPVGAVHRAARTPTYEFVLHMAGQPITHTYRSPFLRSSDVVHLRPEPFAKADEARGLCRGDEPAARLFRRRSRQVHRSTARCRPASATACPPCRPAGSRSTPAPRTVLAVFNNETIPTRTWPAKDNHIVVAEFMN